MDYADIIEKTEAVVETTVGPEAPRVDREGVWPEAGLRAIQHAGLGGLVAPISAGGLGYGMLGLTQVCEVLGRACPSTALCFGMHCVATATVAAKPTEKLVRKWLEPISRGEHLTTLALSEAGSGVHFWVPATELQRKDGHLWLRGRKSFVTSGGYADSYVVSTVAAEPDAPPGRFSCVLVPREAQGIRWGDPWRGLGMRGNASVTMDLDGVRVPEENLLGEEGDELWYFFHVVCPYFLTAMTGTYLGIASAALNEACQHLRQREYSHSGQTLAQQRVLQHRLGELWADLERTRRLSYHAASAGDRGVEDALTAVFSAKAEVAECGVRMVNEAMTLGGGIAYQENARLAQLLRDVRASHVMAPTTDVLRTWVGRTLLGLPLLGD